jgi:uncharacterized glyoxalase superfamily protein PhnB
MSPRSSVALAGLLLATAGLRTDFEGPRAEVRRPTLINTCLISQNMPRLAAFYTQVLAMPAKTVGNEYAEFHTGVGVLAIFSSEAQEKYIPHSTEPGINKSVILEFEVADVDKEFARLQGMVKDWVKPPTNQPWGTRSFYFRDPDGDLVDFFTPAANNGNKKGNQPSL